MSQADDEEDPFDESPEGHEGEDDENEERRDNEQQLICCICSEPTTDGHSCDNDTEVHYMCSDCFLGYLRAELEPGRGFDAVTPQPGNVNLVSRPAQLPCPEFLGTSRCACASLPLVAIFGVLRTSVELSQLYHTACRRVHMREAEVNRTPRDGDEEQQQPEQAPGCVDDIHKAVVAALDEGLVMKCPRCGRPGIKNDACMHIGCEAPHCNTSWCYCCGRVRTNGAARCRGCDSHNAYIEYQPGGWNSFGLAGESIGYGALHEFHRQRMAYFVRRVKETSQPEHWNEFRRSYPNVLSNIPTPGRSIGWEELDTATPPVFGNSTENDLLWKLPPRGRNGEARGPRHRRRQEPLDLEAGPDDLALLPFFEVLLSEHGKWWLGCLSFSVLFLCFRWFVSRANWIVAFGDFFVALTCFFGFKFVLCRVADEAALDVMLSGEVHFLGNGDHAPLLSQIGRWRNQRDRLVRCFVGCLAAGSFFIGTAGMLGPLEEFNRALGSTLVTFVTMVFVVEGVLNNLSPPPYDNELQTMTTYLMTKWVNVIFIAFLAIGVGLVTGHSAKAHDAGSFLISFGVAGWVGDNLPRFFRGDINPWWSPLPNPHFRVISHLFFMSITVGSLFVSLWNSYYVAFLRLLGICILCIGFPGSIVYWCIVSNG